MLAYQAQTYDDILSGASYVAYTDTRFDRLSGSIEARAHQFVATIVSGSPRLTVQVEHSSDGRTWIPRTGTPEINGVALVAPVPVVFYISADDGQKATGPLVRLKLSLDAAGGAVQVRAYTVGRTRRPGKPGPIAPGDDCGCGSPKKSAGPALPTTTPHLASPQGGNGTTRPQPSPARALPAMMSAAKPR